MKLALQSRAPAALRPKHEVPRLLRTALVDWAIVIAAWLALALTPTILAPLWVLIVAGRLHALGVLLHDLVHTSARERARLGWIVEALCGYPIGTTTLAMSYHHIRHHENVGTRLDPYFDAASVGRPVVQWLRALRLAFMVPFWVARGPVGVVALCVPALRNLYARVFLLDVTGEDRRHDAAVLACARAEIAQVVVHGVALCLALVLIGPLAVLIGYGLPAIVAGLLCGLRDALDHRATATSPPCDHDLGLVGALALAPHNVGCHVVHHWHPEVSFDALSRLRDWYVERLGAHYPRERTLIG